MRNKADPTDWLLLQVFKIGVRLLLLGFSATLVDVMR